MPQTKPLTEKREIVNKVLKYADEEKIPVIQALKKLNDQGLLNICKDTFYEYKKDVSEDEKTKSAIVADTPQLIKSNTIFSNPIQSNSEQIKNDESRLKESNTILKKLSQPKKRINISLSDEIISWLEVEADFSSVPVANQCSKIISDYVRERLK
jgi:hypothetical protein